MFTKNISHSSKYIIHRLIVPILTISFVTTSVSGQSDLFMRDRPTDTGIEPYVGPGPIYASEDIWVRNDPDPNYSPYPFTTTAPVWTPLPHQNPEYRNPNTGQPNYIYVQVSNRGTTPSTGTERLRVYQAKAGTGLSWPTNWVDYVDNSCGNDELYGIEVTKPRRNAKNVTLAERDAYITALNKLNTDTLLQYSDGIQYWRKQNDIHAVAGNAQHGNPAFLPWHREMMNRFEAHLKEADPLVTLLYWDWTEDPRFGATDLFTTSFMGASSGLVNSPITDLQPPTLERDVAFSSFSPDSDASIQLQSNYPDLNDTIEASPNHNSSHGFIGGSNGQISFLSTAAQDPFFFLLHGNVDRLWANWQRDAALPERIDPIANYGSDSSNLQINDSMSPWDGATGVAPWDSVPYAKTSKDRSIVNPPIYDTAPVNIPVLQPGESVIMEIPWYPPNIANFNCQGQAGHFCLLARIETLEAAPYGMTFPEGGNVGTNTRNNNNIVWKNLTIVDDVTELHGGKMTFTSGTTIRNTFLRDVKFILRLRDRTPKRENLVFDQGKLKIKLPAHIAKRVLAQDDKQLHGIKIEKGRDLGNTKFLVTRGDANLTIPLKKGEKFTVEVEAEFDVDLKREVRKIPFEVDIEQVLVPRDGMFMRVKDEQTVIGGVRFQIDLSKINLVKKGTEWLSPHRTDMAILKQAKIPNKGEFEQVGFPIDTKVKSDNRQIYLKRFTIGDPDVLKSLRLSVIGSEGFAVLVNGIEVYRRNLSDGELSLNTRAIDKLKPFDANSEWITSVNPAVLMPGENALAAIVFGSEEKRIKFDLGLTANHVNEEMPPQIGLSIDKLNRTHFSVGEPIRLGLDVRDQNMGVTNTNLLLNGKTIMKTEKDSMEGVIRIEKPGIHTLSMKTVGKSGLSTTKQVRVLVSKNIPPNVLITRPQLGQQFFVGDEVIVDADATAAFGKETKSVELFVKKGDFIATDLNLVKNKNYQVVSKSDTAPYRLTFKPTEPGKYMLQLGVKDNDGVVGVSRHTMIMVRKR